MTDYGDETGKEATRLVPLKDRAHEAMEVWKAMKSERDATRSLERSAHQMPQSR